ncbi:bactofilin family protein [Perlucidibaca aquatica]|jgi:cytoskeletal protein CcmA (bactofilin family)|uniref:bactofilin family protein n=1 Tax=Perlucidibaca aquatica TaxID=1852776 RepID=UPI00083A5B69|nr:polymer-forming cytoskeletal protein [Perlucidibaca aquatica]
MFNPKQKKTDLSAYKDHSFISKQARIQGDIHFQGALHVEGRIEGQVVAKDGCLHLHGEIVGDIDVANAVINGVVRGNLTCHEHLELASEAQVFGTVNYHSLEMMLGGQVTGLMQPMTKPTLSVVKEPAA